MTAAVLLALLASLPQGSPEAGYTATFSIAAVDTTTGEMGIAVASCVPFVGRDVPWARAGVGAVATQAWVNQSYGPDGLALLESGHSPAMALDSLLKWDPDSEQRQVGIVSAAAEAVSFTGAETMDWAGGLTGPGYAVQGNILVGEDVVTSMEEAFLATEGPLAVRLLAALQSGEDAGGDSRGRQSAAILVVREGAGHGGCTDVFVDIAVSDHPEPIPELSRLYGIWERWYVLPVYLDDGEGPETEWALGIINRVAEESPDDPQVLNSVAWALAERGLHPERAVELALRAHGLAPDDHNIMDTVATAHYAAGDYAEAVRWERSALELDPGNEFYLEQLERFRQAAEELQ